VSSPLSRIAALAVHLHGERVGVIARVAGDRHLFTFEESYLEDHRRQTLSLSFKSTAGGLVVATRAYAAKLPAFFSNLLPEGHLRTYLARRAGVAPDRELELLGLLGADLPGAVTVSPLQGAVGSGGEIPITQLLRMNAQGDGVLRFSLAGVQLKFSAVHEPTGGLTIPVDGMGGSWIAKLPSSRFARVPENEYVMLELARAIGIEVPQTRLIDVAAIRGLPTGIDTLTSVTGSNALAIERFDRAAGTRIHTEDFAQVFGLFPAAKYEKRSYANIAAVLAAEAGAAAVDDFTRRLMFSVLIGNADMHLKNWSLLYRDGRRPTLAPAYDYVSTIVYLPNDRLALSLGGSNSLESVSLEQLRRFADAGQLAVSSVVQAARRTVEQVLDVWPRLTARDVLMQEMRARIETHMEKVARDSFQ
jgi:serine/threonine-protein kinase HipA